MQLERFFLILLGVISGCVTGSLAMLAKKRGDTAENRVFSLFLLAISIYAFGYAGELTGNTIPDMLFWSNIQYLGIVFIAPLWIMLALLYNGLEKWLSRPMILLLLFLPLLTLLIKWTNLNHLFYIQTTISFSGPFPVFTPIKGIWYWIHIIYFDISLLLGMLLFLLMWRRATTLYRQQVGLLFIGFSFPWFGHLIYLFGLSPWGLDLGSLFLTLTAILTFWGFNSFHLFDIVPIARTKVFESIRDGVLVLDIQNRIVDVNTVAQQMLNLDEKSLGLPIRQAVSHCPLLLAQLNSEEEQTIIRLEKRGQVLSIESRLNKITNSFGRIIGYTVSLTDKSEQIALLNQLQIMATVDSLTNTFNRQHFFAESRRELLRLETLALPVSLVMIDLDHFKEINDTYGHQAGDVILREFAANLQCGISPHHLLGRIGGEEFAILLPEASLTEAYNFAEKLRMNVNPEILINGHRIQVTASFGVSNLDIAGRNDLDVLYSQADQALYISKNKGRNMVTVFETKN